MTDAPPGLAELCSSIQQLLPPELGPHAWYFLIAAILTNSPTPTHFASLYTHLLTLPAFLHQPSSQSRLSLQLRDILLKQTTLLGAPQVLTALIPFATASLPSSTTTTTSGPTTLAAAASTSTLSPQYTYSSPTLHYKSRGTSTINTIYGPQLLPKIFDSFGSHSQDIQHMELFTVYGLYLSDFTLLTPLETELIVFVSILSTGLRGPSLWHMRGLGRLLGARGSDDGKDGMGKIKDCLRSVKVAAMQVVEWCGGEYVARSRMEEGGEGRGWPNVGDVVRELGEWGDDEFVEGDGGEQRQRQDRKEGEVNGG